MKILYFGTVCNLNAYNKRMERYSRKLSVAPIVFENALLEGLNQNLAEVEIHSFPMIETFPLSRELFFGGNIEALPCGYFCRWIRTVNLPFLKQFSRNLDARIMMKRWLKKNKEDGIVFTYSIPPFLVKSVLRYSKKYNVKAVAIIPDLLRDMYINEKAGSVFTKLKNRYLSQALKLQGEYDGYVYLTQAMKDVVAPEKPYIVMEGVADISSAEEPDITEKASPHAIMYAGMIHEKYGIINLLDAFEQLKNKDIELWLFGDGTAVPKVLKRSKQNPKIRYFGTVPREEILRFERKATLLVNPRNTEELFTQYSFPSKTIEYMLSGTPLVTTKLSGIPDEYFNYVFAAESNEPTVLADILNKALANTQNELIDFGNRAQLFVKEQKNSCKQAARILEFFKEVKYELKV